MLDLQIFIQTHKQRPQDYSKYISASACQVKNDAFDLLFLDKDGLKWSFNLKKYFSGG